MDKLKILADIRRDYGSYSLNEEHLLPDPIAQFKLWFEEVLKKELSDPTAMVLSTVDEKNHPDSRVVLLKGLERGHFIFYTNYQSAKAAQINNNPYGALNFHWQQMARQVRIRGQIKKITEKKSDSYFSKRPLKSQFSAIASPQSQVIENREFLEQAFNKLIEANNQQSVSRPKYWGGYKLIPNEIEFWQGRDNRLHDRIHYYHHQNIWFHRRLAP